MIFLYWEGSKYNLSNLHIHSKRFQSTANKYELIFNKNY